MFSRYFVVCFAPKMIGREKDVGNQIHKFAVLTSLFIGVISIAYSKSSLIFLTCMGKEERFRFDFTDLGEKNINGVGTNLEFLNPFRILVNLTTMLFIFVVPTLYYKIFQFRKEQDSSIQGNNKQIT
jgi:hypothetical protein